MTETTQPPNAPARGKYHPFRTVAVEAYERPLPLTTPVVSPYWRWSLVALSFGSIVLAGLVWWA